jgi:hypothetical protein
MISWHEVWIIGGGKSVQDFELNSLQDKRVIVINNAIDLYPNATAVFSLDANWVRKHKEFLKNLDCEKYIALPLETFPDCAGIDGVEYYKWSYQQRLSDDPEVLCTGCNSGYSVINLCYLKGSRVIHLLGYDMQFADNDQFQFWAPRFRDMLPQLELKGIKVFNHSKYSTIDAFERV